MLAVVFGWARRLLLAGVDRGDDVLEHIRRTETWVKVLTVGIVVLAIGGVAAWLVL